VAGLSTSIKKPLSAFPAVADTAEPLRDLAVSAAAEDPVCPLIQESLSRAVRDHTIGPSDAGSNYSFSRILTVRKLWPISVVFTVLAGPAPKP
jgi:hypothetical protein